METNEMVLLETEKERNPFILGNTVEMDLQTLQDDYLVPVEITLKQSATMILSILFVMRPRLIFRVSSFWSQKSG